MRIAKIPSWLLAITWTVSLLSTPQVQGQQGKQEPAPTPDSMSLVGSRDSVIGPNDALMISVMDAEELSKPWRVGPEGDLNLPLIGPIQAAGKTVDEFEKELTERLKTIIRNPEAHVSVVSQKSQPVTVMGAVGSPGSVQLQGGKTLLDVLVAVGGPREAGPTVTLTRKAEYGRIPLPEAREEEGGKYMVAELNLKDVMTARTAAANVTVVPYDVITVSMPKKLQRLVHIIGDVQKSGAVELVQQESVSIMQALAAAGGATRTAALNRTVIMHVTPEGVRSEIAVVDLKKILEGKAKDLDLIAGDIVVVPSSQLKVAFDVVSKTALSSSTMMLARF